MKPRNEREQTAVKPPERSVGRTTLGLLCCALIFQANPAQARMTVYDLTDVALLRLEDISFFAFLLLLATLGIRFLWNYRLPSFAACQPALRYRRTLLRPSGELLGRFRAAEQVKGASLRPDDHRAVSAQRPGGTLPRFDLQCFSNCLGHGGLPLVRQR